MSEHIGGTLGEHAHDTLNVVDGTIHIAGTNEAAHLKSQESA